MHSGSVTGIIAPRGTHESRSTFWQSGFRFLNYVSLCLSLLVFSHHADHVRGCNSHSENKIPGFYAIVTYQRLYFSYLFVTKIAHFLKEDTSGMNPL